MTNLPNLSFFNSTPEEREKQESLKELRKDIEKNLIISEVNRDESDKVISVSFSLPTKPYLEVSRLENILSSSTSSVYIQESENNTHESVVLIQELPLFFMLFLPSVEFKIGNHTLYISTKSDEDSLKVLICSSKTDKEMTVEEIFKGF
jgi:hypothetical protein